jgi:hypothetical protein
MKDVNATVIIDLKNKTQEELFNAIDHSRRKNIKKSIRKGVTFEKELSEKDILKAHEIYKQVWIKGGATPDSYEQWKEKLSKGYVLFIIKHKGKTIGSALTENITKEFFNINSKERGREVEEKIKEKEERGIRFRAFSSNSDFNDLRPNDALYWNVIKYSNENKLDFVDLGGWQINARGHLKGVNRFKLQWGGEVFYYKKDYSFFTAIGRKLIRNTSFFWWLNKKIKGRK